MKLGQRATAFINYFKFISILGPISNKFYVDFNNLILQTRLDNTN